jgi:hypothetical protein
MKIKMILFSEKYDNRTKYLSNFLTLLIMMKKNWKVSGLFVLALILFTGVLKAEIKLPAIFGDYMVLQSKPMLPFGAKQPQASL